MASSKEKVTSKALSSGASEISLGVGAAEFMACLGSKSDQERLGFSFAGSSSQGKPFLSKIDGTRFRISRRIKVGQNIFSRVLYGQVSEASGRPILRYHLAVKKEVKAVMALVCAVYAMVFLVLLYADPPRPGQEMCYVLPLLLPLLVALIMCLGIAAGRHQEKELVDFVCGLCQPEPGSP